MNSALVDKIVQAVLYEGYILYPYRRSVKNEQRWTFGCIFPRDYGGSISGAESFMTETQCLIKGDARATLTITARFLQLLDRTVGQCTREDAADFAAAGELEIAGKRHQTWQEAVERTISVQANLSGTPRRTEFTFPTERHVELLRNGASEIAGAFIRTQQTIQGALEVETVHQRDGIYRLTARVLNLTPLGESAKTDSRQLALSHACASAHLIFHAAAGEFLSQIDPPADAIDLAHQCEQKGAWPVLVGEPGQRDTVLASPIILYDYPEIAPESPGNLFDGTEIDEILSLCVMTLTDEEKRSAADLDPRSAELMNRTQSLAREQLMRLHGVLRPPRPVQAVHIADSELRAGDRVRLRPRGSADAFDIILKGKIATIAAIEQDYENRIHLAVTIDDDPGADIGAAGQIGHRFFFRPEEVEPLTTQEAAS